MANEQWPHTPPRSILLATDLSARSDRALDRATQLARQWNAALVVVHALESEADAAGSPAYEDLPSWRRPPDPVVAVERQIRRDIREPLPDLRITVREGVASDVILDALERERCDLVVVGAGGDRGLGRVSLGRTVELLMRRAPTSVLVVKSRPAGPYRHILVGTDFTPEARHGLTVASKLFPEASFAVMHSFEMPYRSLFTRPDLSREFTQMEQEEIRAFVKDAGLDPDVHSRVVTLIEHGPPEVMMHNYVAERGADLTVIGTVGRNTLFHLLIGGHAPKIVDGVQSDVLVVRFPAQDE